MTADTKSVAEFINKSTHEFIDISSEEYRQYVFLSPDGAPVAMRFHRPLKLSVSASGGHRLFDAEGDCHYIPAGWITLSWKAKEGQPHFVA